MTTNSDLGGSDLNANLTATTKPYITGCNDKYKTVTVVNTETEQSIPYEWKNVCSILCTLGRIIVH